MQEVVTLQQLIGEFRKAQAVARLAVETPFHTVLGHHVVHRDVLAYLAGEVQERVGLHPVVVVHQLGAVGGVGVEVDEARQLLLYGFLVVAQRFLVEQIAFGRFARRVAYHARGAAHQYDGFVAAALQMPEHHHAAQMAYVEAVGRRVDA